MPMANPAAPPFVNTLSDDSSGRFDSVELSGFRVGFNVFCVVVANDVLSTENMFGKAGSLWSEPSKIKGREGLV